MGRVTSAEALGLRPKPWQNGKAILTAVGSRSLMMPDVFKSQKNWRALIASNGRGACRLIGD